MTAADSAPLLRVPFESTESHFINAHPCFKSYLASGTIAACVRNPCVLGRGPGTSGGDRPRGGTAAGGKYERVVRALESLGAPLPVDTVEALARARAALDAGALQRRLDAHVLLVVTINPEERVKVGRGPAAAVLQQGGYTPVLVKVMNEAATVKALRITSPQSGPITAGAADLSLARQDQRHLKEGEAPGGAPVDCSRLRWSRASP